MKSFNQLLSRTIIIMAAIVFLASQNAFAQEKEKEAKVVKIKISKLKGDEVIIDTIYMADLEDLEGLELKEELEKIIDIELDGLEDMETLEDIYISVDSDFDFDSDSDIDREKNVMIWTTVSDEGSKKVIELKCEEGGERIMFINDGDSTQDSIVKRIVLKQGDGKKNVFHIKSGEGQKTIWLSDGDAKLEADKGYVFITEAEGDSKKFRIAMEKAGIKLPESHLELKELYFFPNPNEGQFTLSFSTEKKGDLDVKVIDINGKVVHQETFNNFTGKYNKEIDITENSKGTYFLIIQHGKDVAAHKIIYQ